MIDQEKVKVLTQMSIYDKRHGEKEKKIVSNYKRDYIFKNIIKVCFFATIGYLGVVGVIVFSYFMIYDISYNNLFIDKELQYIVIGFVVLISIYSVVSHIVYGKIYDKAYERFEDYNDLFDEFVKHRPRD